MAEKPTTPALDAAPQIESTTSTTAPTQDPPAQPNRDLPPVIPLSTESDRPLLPSSNHSMGSGLADHDSDVLGVTREELWMDERDLKWEARDRMRGLGINSAHHVSSSVSFAVLKSRAYAEAYPDAPRQSGVHTRFTEDHADGDASCSSIAAVSDSVVVS